MQTYINTTAGTREILIVFIIVIITKARLLQAYHQYGMGSRPAL
jgi:hypothetical protein